MEASVSAGLLQTMWTIRVFEERVSDLFRDGEIPGFVHLSLGQEAVAAGVCGALRPDDYIHTTHRGHGHCLAKGADPGRVLAEIMGRADGYCGGKGGSMHVAAPEVGVLGANAIVGANLPLATGAAWAAAEAGRGQVVVVFFGDGAASQGVFHESLNLAALWRLPIIFVCENNGYAEFTPQAVHRAVASIADWAAGYAIPASQVDGDDACAVYDQARQAVERARAGAGPTLLECLTHRWRGHYEGDPQAYRPEDELAQWRLADPIQRLERRLVAEGGTEDDARAIEARARAAVEEAARFARSSPTPAEATAFADVLA